MLSNKWVHIIPVDWAVFNRPFLKASLSFLDMTMFLAPPVTEMSRFGLWRPQILVSSHIMSSISVSSDTLTYYNHQTLESVTRGMFPVSALPRLPLCTDLRGHEIFRCLQECSYGVTFIGLRLKCLWIRDKCKFHTLLVVTLYHLTFAMLAFGNSTSP